MRSPQLTLCAAVAACAVTTAPAHTDDERGARTAQVAVTPAPAARPALAPATTPAHPAEGPARPPRPATAPSAQPAAAHRELSSTSAVTLVLAGGAILVIAGQLLRLRLRLRRERQGSSGVEE
ncbi:hypothetical protein [Streptomyces sp. GS7]|uniref:hypothetical protein n=1 Tax=Streptomyces sp. GS7 TaxID=2692234 RepID=UPI0013179790|nr:hypothetical protein [Streptomyces sp. GS7]QHC20919.1 hypothetical protein GR130_05205 [Streptomyces sp. GS7]